MQLMNKHGGDAVRGQPQSKVQKLLVKITSDRRDSVDIVTVNMLLVSLYPVHGNDFILSSILKMTSD